MLENTSDESKDIIVLPDGRVDIFFSYSATEPYHVVLMGLETEPTETVLQAKTITFVISLKLLAVEYLFDDTLSIVGVWQEGINYFDN